MGFPTRLQIDITFRTTPWQVVAGRNLNFFTSYYKYLISFLPAAVVAPLYFKGEIEFGVINQSASAFNHILGDFSLVVYQFESIAGFSAVRPPPMSRAPARGSRPKERCSGGH